MKKTILAFALCLFALPAAAGCVTWEMGSLKTATHLKTRDLVAIGLHLTHEETLVLETAARKHHPDFRASHTMGFVVVSDNPARVLVLYFDDAGCVIEPRIEIVDTATVEPDIKATGAFERFEMLSADTGA